MIKREAQNTLIRLAKQFPVVAITGPRQSGKTTLAKMTFPEKKYITFDDQQSRSIAKENPRDFLLAFPEGAIFDEAQKVPEIFDAIKMVVDENISEVGKFILTGSSQFRLKENISDSLAGRIGLVNLLPLSINELKNENILPKNIYDLIIKGTYPTIYDSKRNVAFNDWYSNYVETYINIDVKENINAKNLATFKKFIRACAHYNGQIINLNDISNKLGISSSTLNNWLSILTSSYIVHLVQPETNNIIKSLVKKPKLYFVDPGLLCYLLNIKSIEELILSEYKGHIIESVAMSEIFKYSYNKGMQPNVTFLRTKNGYEVDAIARLEENYAIEIKSNVNTHKKDTANVNKLNNITENEFIGYVFYTGDFTVAANDITFVSWTNWGDIFNINKTKIKNKTSKELKFATNEDIDNLFKN